MPTYILPNKTLAAYQQVHLFSDHILLPFLSHLQRGSVSSFSLGIELAQTYQRHTHLKKKSHDPSIIRSPNYYIIYIPDLSYM